MKISCKIAYYSQEKKLEDKFDIEGSSSGFVLCLIDDGGFEFEPEKIGAFTNEEKNIMKIYYDESSLSVFEGYSSVRENIQDPNMLKGIWKKIRTYILNDFKNTIYGYHNSMCSDLKYLKQISERGLSENSNIEIFDVDSLTKHMSEYEFKHLIFGTIWTNNLIGQILTHLDIAIKKGFLVEVTAKDC